MRTVGAWDQGRPKAGSTPPREDGVSFVIGFCVRSSAAESVLLCTSSPPAFNFWELVRCLLAALLKKHTLI